MSRCLYCHTDYAIHLTWESLFNLHSDNGLCQNCDEQLQEIKGEICNICGRSFSLFPEQYRQDNMCHDCIRWEEDENWHGVLARNRSLYVYNSHMQEMLSKYKYRGDAELAKVFHQKVRTLYKKEFRRHFLVPIPLSEERHLERGFNQSLLITNGVAHVHSVLVRTSHEEKQSKKSRAERMNISGRLFSAIMDVSQKDVLLVDDVYTTGSTIRQAAKELLEAGASSVSSITLAR
ncbi:phosphoribosyltransferase family protein [Fictibacillus iocasae]|uniref:Phosphoribosyltransferase family protein n=1 Tax=Fictibacillus iocasae TaxID=2715437 RepID=A0ABW2NUL5_9BACL